MKEIIKDIITMIAPYVVMIVTLHVQKIRSSKAASCREHQFGIQLQQNEKHYVEQQRMQYKQMLLSARPYLVLKTDAHWYSQGKEMRINFELVNSGCNLAHDIRLITTIDKDVSLLANRTNDETEFQIRYSDYIKESLLQVNQSAQFQIVYIKYIKGEDKDVFVDGMTIPVSLTISFLDIMDNKYVQEFSFIVSSAFKSVTRITSYAPKLEEDKSCR